MQLENTIRKLALSAVLLSASALLPACVAVHDGGYYDDDYRYDYPPPRPYHGYRYAYPGGLTLIFDSGPGMYAVFGHPDYYFFDGFFYRWNAGYWNRTQYWGRGWQRCEARHWPRPISYVQNNYYARGNRPHYDWDRDGRSGRGDQHVDRGGRAGDRDPSEPQDRRGGPRGDNWQRGGRDQQPAPDLSGDRDGRGRDEREHGRADAGPRGNSSPRRDAAEREGRWRDERAERMTQAAHEQQRVSEERSRQEVVRGEQERAARQHRERGDQERDAREQQRASGERLRQREVRGEQERDAREQQRASEERSHQEAVRGEQMRYAREQQRVAEPDAPVERPTRDRGRERTEREQSQSSGRADRGRGRERGDRR